MMLLHARFDVVEGSLDKELIGAPTGIDARTFVVLTLTDDDGREGVGEASPLPGYSPDDVDAVVDSLEELVDVPIEIDPALPARTLLDQTPEVQLAPTPSARFAIESAILDWLGRYRGVPVHRLLTSTGGAPVDLASLVFEPDPARWLAAARAIVAGGVSHLKFKVGHAFDAEVSALGLVRGEHPEVTMRLDANRRLSIEELERQRPALADIGVEFLEEPVAEVDLERAGLVGLPLALDETLRREAPSRAMLPNPNVVALVIKPSVLGGVTAALDLAKIARTHHAEPVLSHVFEGPIARAACAEIALAVAATRAQGLGVHPCLDLWPSHSIAAIEGATIRPHAEPGLGLRFEEVVDA